MDKTALFTITYGVYILGVATNERYNACVINTLSQVTQTPERVSVTVLKSNLTHDMVQESKQFSVSVLGKHAELDMIARFGFQSGREVDKLVDFPYHVDTLDNPVIEVGAVATMSCKVINEIDLGTHTLFIGDVVEARNLDKEEPMTYAYYRDLKMGKVTQTSEDKTLANEKVEESVANKETYQCSVCHYVYDGETPFEELPDDYKCPLCNQPKSVFVKN